MLLAPQGGPISLAGDTHHFMAMRRTADDTVRCLAAIIGPTQSKLGYPV
jgi:hypothetical protein